MPIISFFLIVGHSPPAHLTFLVPLTIDDDTEWEIVLIVVVPLVALFELLAVITKPVFSIFVSLVWIWCEINLTQQTLVNELTRLGFNGLSPATTVSVPIPLRVWVVGRELSPDDYETENVI